MPKAFGAFSSRSPPVRLAKIMNDGAERTKARGGRSGMKLFDAAMIRSVVEATPSLVAQSLDNQNNY